MGSTRRIDLSAPADIVAPQLLGSTLSFGEVAIRLTEVEAYLGADDPASHAARGRTPRCATMFGPPSRLYVYLSYGIHRAGNVVCGPEGTASAVLLRAGEVVRGLEVARARRGFDVPTRTPASPRRPSTSRCADTRLASGPGNLGKALGLDLHLDGCEIVHAPEDASAPGASAPRPVLLLSAPDHPVDWCRSPRIGITKNAEAPLRFFIPGDPTVSPLRRPRTRGSRTP